ncbi:MAG: PspC domain-containing protein [Dermatophilaceae bacterium]
MTATPTAPSALGRLFDTLSRSPVIRSDQRIFAGVCSGVAERTGISPGLVRVLTVVLGLFGPALALYLIAWLLLPDRQGRIHLDRALRQGHGGSIALLVVTVLVVVPDTAGHHGLGWFWVALVLAVIVARSASRRASSQPPAPPAPVTSPPAPMWGPVPTQPPAGPQDAPRY